MRRRRWTAGDATSGNGDGVRRSGTTPWPRRHATDATIESRLWWDHLRRAGFVSGNGDQQPFNALTGKIGVQTGDGAAGSRRPAAERRRRHGDGFTRLIMCSANLPDKIAIAVDTQMDDGVPATGHGARRSSRPRRTRRSRAQAAAATTRKTGTNVYTICRSL